MQMNRQTVWLVTMLTLMVALSAYYIITGPVEPVGPLAQNNLNENQVQVDTKPVNQAAKKESVASEYFVYQNLQRQTMREKLLDEYYNILGDTKASKEKLAEAEKMINSLTKLDKQEEVMENLLRQEGYQDAVVFQEDGKVNVLVQSSDLKNAQVVKILDLAKQQLGMGASQVSVSYRP
ncbi:SpoIIIAH-like family protein [Risungbinella massiliensis]|uniref:SpoIIIAH-like family protein n=1 Tax=Risungbinella massiliensis TaxID=1329796 RepID=UPI0005CC6DAB|nr:SpoIIIAH-like family protein [Risungbinella massiliensis]